MIKFSKASTGQEEIDAVSQVLREGWLAAGPKTKSFEEQFAKYIGVKYAIFTNSCTSALKMAYRYVREEYGIDRVTIPRNTYSATYAAAFEMGLKYRFDHETKSGFTVSVHYGGIKHYFPRSKEFAIIEDSAHRIEKDDPLDSKIRCYSFYVTKNMTTGSGGMFVTNDEDIYKKARLWWSDGINKTTFDRQHGGWNYSVLADAGGYDGNDIAAAIGIEQLKKLPEFTRRRNEIRDIYNEAFGQCWKGNHLFPYFTDHIKETGPLIEYLKTNGVQASYHYPGNDWNGVSLPIYPDLTNEEQARVIDLITNGRWEN